LLETKKKWICRNLARIRGGNPPDGTNASSRPDVVSLEAFGENWEVFYDSGADSRDGLIENEESHRLLLAGPGECCDPGDLLRKWLVKRSRLFLEPKLARLSANYAMPYKKFCVRLQKTRWGSCSARGNISLNAKLAFLPGGLVDYVLFHELCHTIHMNHSRSFWDLMERKLPGSLALRNDLRKAESRVPSWVERGRCGMRISSSPEVLTINLRWI
jgi:predicted metal-dependent hydrolase